MEQTGNILYAAYELRVEHLLAERGCVTCRCLGCQHEGTVDPYRLVAKWGRHHRLKDIEHKLRCTRCRSRGYCTLRIEWRDVRR